MTPFGPSFPQAAHRGAVLCGLLLALAAPANALDLYAVSPEACSAPPDGVIQVQGSSILIGETSYKRVGPKRDLGGGWFEALYDGEAEGEPIGTRKLRVHLTAAEIVVEIDGERFAMQACPR